MAGDLGHDGLFEIGWGGPASAPDQAGDVTKAQHVDQTGPEERIRELQASPHEQIAIGLVAESHVRLERISGFDDRKRLVGGWKQNISRAERGGVW